jgi:hypothetical protein
MKITVRNLLSNLFFLSRSCPTSQLVDLTMSHAMSPAASSLLKFTQKISQIYLRINTKLGSVYKTWQGGRGFYCHQTNF